MCLNGWIWRTDTICNSIYRHSAYTLTNRSGPIDIFCIQHGHVLLAVPLSPYTTPMGDEHQQLSRLHEGWNSGPQFLLYSSCLCSLVSFFRVKCSSLYSSCSIIALNPRKNLFQTFSEKRGGCLLGVGHSVRALQYRSYLRLVLLQAAYEIINSLIVQ